MEKTNSIQSARDYVIPISDQDFPQMSTKIESILVLISFN